MDFYNGAPPPPRAPRRNGRRRRGTAVNARAGRGQGVPPPTHSAAPVEAVGVQLLQSSEQSVGVVVQPFGILHAGIQEFAGVHRQADGIVRVALRVATELSKAGALISTVAHVRGGEGGVLLRSPTGRLSGTGVGGYLRQGHDAIGNLFALVEQAALLTLQVAQSKVFHILEVLFEELQGEGVGSGESHRVGCV